MSEIRIYTCLYYYQVINKPRNAVYVGAIIDNVFVIYGIR